MPLHNYRRKPCEFCAFRPGSPERADPDYWGDLMLSCCHKVFYCHKTMFKVSGDERAGAYDPERKSDGSLAERSDHQVCAGFARHFGAEFGIDTRSIQPATTQPNVAIIERAP